MALEEHLDDFPVCSSIPHAILNIQLVYCSHDRGYTLSCTLGDTTEIPWSRKCAHYGPFDDSKDVAHDIGSWVAVMFRRTLLDASLGYHDGLRAADEVQGDHAGE